jgi:hypothetical protein
MAFWQWESRGGFRPFQEDNDPNAQQFHQGIRDSWVRLNLGISLGVL